VHTLGKQSNPVKRAWESSQILSREPENGKALANEPNSSTHTAFGVLTALLMESTVFWDITPFSPLKVKILLVACFMIGGGGCLGYSSTLKMEVAYFY
jgi:hypothetical protein